jgi:hypothetical protein
MEKSWAWRHTPVTPTIGSWSRQPGQKARPYLKTKQKNRAKRAGGLAQTVEHLPHKHKTLSSNPNTVKKKKSGDFHIIHSKI